MDDGTQTVLNVLFGDVPPPRALIATSANGLANRLKVLVSGLTLAADSRRAFVMVWPRTAACGAAYADLFQNPLPVIDAPQELADLPCFRHPGSAPRPLSNLMQDTPAHIMVKDGYWLIYPPGRSPTVAAQARWARFLDALTPIPTIKAQIADCRERHFRSVMIGVHLRRGDFMRVWPDQCQSIPAAFQAVDHFLDVAPQAGIFLCTDDGAVDPVTRRPTPPEGIRAAFQQRYEARVVGYSLRSLDRSTPEAVQDALAELWLLRSTDYFVGTLGSSFSTMTCFGRSVPRIVSPAATPAEARLGEIVHAIGLGRLVCGVARRRWGHDLPFPLAWNWFVRLRLAVARRARRQVYRMWR